MNIDPQTIVGKTIQSIDSEAENCWIIRFTDGTAVTLEGVNGVFNIPIPILYPFNG